MPNLVGIGNSQIPTNAMLGGLAYQDSVGEIDIEKIKARTSNTAVDVFVYDTRKDSDGGAWRHRTQNLSWYNEGVSELRGARKEFPAVAILVLESLKLTIYDGDDPNLPMWMVLTGVNNNYAIETQATCTAALNGVICIGCGSRGHDFYYVNFLQDAAYEFSTGGHNKFVDNIGTRSSHTRRFGEYSGVIISRKINDVAMTVLPNAPIDEITGLPIPTIAIATDGGVSIIRNNGTTEETTVFDIVGTTSGYVASRKVEFSNSGEYLYIIQDPSIIYSYKTSTLTKDYSGGTLTGYAGLTFFGSWVSGSGSAGGAELARGNDIHINVGDANTGLALLYPDYSYTSNSLDNSSGKMICRVTKDFNTGWMHGDIKGAFLSDTDTTNVTGSELVTNGTFASNISGWTGGVQWVHSTNNVGGNTGGKLMVFHTASTNIYISQTITTVSGKYYTITYLACSDQQNKARVWIGGTYYDYIVDNNNAALVRHQHTFQASGTSTEIRLYTNGNSRSYWDSISVRVAELDHSVNNNGLQVHGTITKESVAFGAELVSYNSLSSSNYLEQPYNSDLDFGTGDFCMMGWFYNLGTSASVLYRLHNSTTAGVGYIVATSSSGEIGYSSYTQGFRSAGRITHYTSDSWNGLQQWNMFICGKKNGVGYMYVNGLLKASGANNQSHTDTTYQPPLRIGNNYAGNGGIGSGKLALIRISSGFPTDEQIKKIYDDEKCLFHKNSKCTLNGTSNAVVALAHDDVGDVLHVGTSSGRSEFRGLNRINNTTTAVTTAISASNELVAEQ